MNCNPSEKNVAQVKVGIVGLRKLKKRLDHCVDGLRMFFVVLRDFGLMEVLVEKPATGPPMVPIRSETEASVPSGANLG